MTRLPAFGLSEEWRPIRGYEDRYEVSSFGQVRSLFYHCWNRFGRRSKPLMLKPTPGDDGHLRVGVVGKEKREHRYVHHLVLETFAGPCPLGHECAHGDGNAQNNRLDNLRWATKTENEWDKIGHGTRPLRILPKNVLEIRERLARGESQSSIARLFSLHQTMIHKIKTGKAWAHVH